MTHSLARVVATALLAAPALGGASAPGDPLEAARRLGTLTVDGRLDEPAWESAPAFDGFVQRFPVEKAAPLQATEVRVLYDDWMLYVGVRCRD